MNNYILIAVGGTGARVAQSVVALAAAGMPAELGVNSNKEQAQFYIKLVDIDVNHNEGKELYNLIASYNEAVNKHFVEDSENDIFEDKFGGKMKWKPMPIKMCSENDFIFDANLGGAGAKKENVEDIVAGVQGDARLFLDSLLGQDDREMNLLSGCKAKPRIGSLLWQWLYKDDNKGFWEDIRSMMIPGNNTHIMFVGSVFGGTGASGVPTLVKMLRADVKAQPHGEEKYGITLMTPYFQLTPPENAPVQSNKFPFESKMAMEYYETDSELMSLDCVQIVGDRLKTMMNYTVSENEYENESARKKKVWTPVTYTPDEDLSQNNPSMPTELVAAIGVHQFFADANEDNLIIHRHEYEPVEEKSAVYNVNMLPQPTETEICLSRLSRLSNIFLAYYDVLAHQKAHNRPTVFYNLWSSKELRNPDWLANCWLNETHGVGALSRFTKELFRWLDDLDNNGMRNLLRLNEEFSKVEIAARKGSTKFDLYGKAAKDITAIMNDETNQFFNTIQGEPEGKWANKRQVALVKTLLKACE